METDIKKPVNSDTEDSLLFDPAEATTFKPRLFDGEPNTDPEIDLLTVKAISKVEKNDQNDDLDIKHGMMILKSHRKEIAELEDLDEAKVSNKKIAVVMLILLFFVAFIVIMFLLSKLIEDSPSGKKIKTNNTGINRTYK
jgi:hypothetical protein